jgi:uncharacterized protein (DUF2225 family)
MNCVYWPSSVKNFEKRKTCQKRSYRFCLSWFIVIYVINKKSMKKCFCSIRYSWLQKKTGKENFPNVNLVWSICQFNVYLTIPIK